ncbi:MAG: hemerythrin domain-containing protein, partial [Burkholderiales bacterium]
MLINYPPSYRGSWRFSAQRSLRIRKHALPRTWYCPLSAAVFAPAQTTSVAVVARSGRGPFVRERGAASRWIHTMPIKIGQRVDHSFDEPLGLLSDCHRRIEHFLRVLATVAADAAGGPLTAEYRSALDGALRYFAVAAPKHTADEEVSLFPRLRNLDDPSLA